MRPPRQRRCHPVPCLEAPHTPAASLTRSSARLRPRVWSRHYIIEDTIGAGNFAEVKKCAHRETGQPYAVKVIEKRRVDPKRRDKILESECDALRRVQHPNIVALHEIFDTPEKLYIVMEVRR